MPNSLLQFAQAQLDAGVLHRMETRSEQEWSGDRE